MNRLMPSWLRYAIIFAAFACIGSAAAYYIDPTGFMTGVLAVVIVWKLERG